MVSIERLADIREDQDITQLTMSKILKVSRSTYAMWEVGIRLIPIEHLYNYASYFSLSIDYVLGLTNDRTKIKYEGKFNINKIAARLKEIRKLNKVSQSTLAKLLNTTKMSIYNYEHAKKRIPLTYIIEFAKLFNVSINEICNIKEKVYA